MPLAALSPADREPLIEFLCGAFHLPKTAPFVERRLLEWKYDEPRPDWEGTRSYGWKNGNAIAAHACLCPVTYRLDGRQVRASYLIDWASGRVPPGAGAMLLRKLADQFDALLAVGGSEDTRAILPKLGYKVAGQLTFYVRVLRPWRQYRTDPFPRGWKAPLRLARNTVWSRAAAPDAPEGWTSKPIAAFDESHQELLAASRALRTPALMNYWLRCPPAKVSAYLLHRRSETLGWFLLSRVKGVARIADLQVRSEDPAEWRAAFALARQTAAADPETCELIAAASTPLASEALAASGFRRHHDEPVFVLDPKGALAGHTPFDVALIESDGAYLYSDEYPYMT